MCYYVIQGTITKLVSDGAVTIKGCDGFLFKRDSKEYKLLLEKDDIKKWESDGHTEAFSIGNPPVKDKGEYILKELNTIYPLKTGLHEWEFFLFRDAACNNKRVELVLSDKLVVERVAILG